MNLSDAGESRVRGYLYVLERSIRSAVSPQLAADAVREVESHIRERVAESPDMPNERDALEEILTRLGAPTTVARAYSLELMMDEAATGGRMGAVLRTLFHVAGTGLLGFVGALLLFIGYTVGAAFVSVAVLQPLFPANVGLWMHDGVPMGLGARFPAPAGYDLVGGYWIIPLALTIGLAALIGTHRAARRWIGTLRARAAGRRQAQQA
jgi:uncharacterized membrane protein